MTTQKITPFLWFDQNAEEAVALYTSVFEGSRIVQVSRRGPAPDAPVMSIVFELAGQRFMAMNGGPMYQFTPAISLFVSVDSQEELDRRWDKLLEGGGKPTRCGWLTDRFGLSWQIIPTVLFEVLSDPDPQRSGRAMQAMMGMVKLDIAALKRAHAGT